MERIPTTHTPKFSTSRQRLARLRAARRRRVILHALSLIAWAALIIWLLARPHLVLSADEEAAKDQQDNLLLCRAGLVVFYAWLIYSMWRLNKEELKGQQEPK